MAIQLWKPDNLRNPADGDDTFSETSVQTSATRYKVPEDIFKVVVISVYSPCMVYSTCELLVLGSNGEETPSFLPRKADVFFQEPLSGGARSGPTSQQESNVVLAFLPGMILTGLHPPYNCKLPTQFIFTATMDSSALQNVSHKI
jgi:hypothetical protein